MPSRIVVQTIPKPGSPQTNRTPTETTLVSHSVFDASASLILRVRDNRCPTKTAQFKWSSTGRFIITRHCGDDWKAAGTSSQQMEMVNPFSTFMKTMAQTASIISTACLRLAYGMRSEHDLCWRGIALDKNLSITQSKTTDLFLVAN